MENNQLDQLFQLAKNEQPEVSFLEMKSQFLQAVPSTGSTAVKGLKVFTLKNLIIMLVISGVITGVVLMLTTPTNNKNQNDHQKEQKILPDSTQQSKMEAQVLKPKMNEVERIYVEIEPRENIVFRADSVNVSDSSIQEGGFTYEPYVFPGDEVSAKQPPVFYKFPSLTEEEIEANHKQKAKMLKELAKLDKKKYVYVPSGSYTYKGKPVSVQAFYMQTTEVTNLEYRTFLFDLLIHGRNDEFLKAKPNQDGWVNIDGVEVAFNEPMKDLYFSHPAYNQYPVNNVSREGANMYCMWLSKELQAYDKKKGVYNDLRIPTQYEWAYAATGGLNNVEFPWGGSSPLNAEKCFLANYRPLKSTVPAIEENEKGRFRKKNRSNVPLIRGVYEQKSGEELKGGEKYFYAADGAFHTAKVDSYNPNGFGLYNLSGNVAEMVYYHGEDNTPGTKGGGWLSDLDELKIEGEDKYKGKEDPHVNIGFRVVMTYLGR